MSGNKSDIVERLCADPKAAQYSYEPKRFSMKSLMSYGYDSGDEYSHENSGPSGKSTEEIKQIAKSKGLATTGKRYDVVLRLLQLENGTGAPKRAAGDMNENGVFEPKKRAKSMKIPSNVDNLRDRVEAKIFADSSKWSNQKMKDHAHEVFATIAKIFKTEINDKELCQRGQTKLAWHILCEILEEFLEDLTGNGRNITGIAL